MKHRLGSHSFARIFALLAVLFIAAPAAAQRNTAPAVLWQFTPVDGAVMGSALSADGADLVVILGYGFDPGATVISLDPATGDERWAIDIPESPSSDPVIADGVIYAGIGALFTGDSAVYALDAATGKQRWRADVTNRELPATPVDGVTLGGDTLYVNRADGVLLALDAANGAERWSVDLQKPPRGAPFVEGDTVFVSTGFDGAALLAFDVANGEERWRFEHPANPVTGPVVSDGLMYVGFTSGEIVALDAGSGQERWRSLTGVHTEDDPSPPWPGLPLVVDGVLYASSNGFSSAYTQAFDAQTGAGLWTAATGDFSASAPALDGDVLLVGSDSGDLLGLDPATGTELWRVAIPNKIDIDLNQAGPPLAGDNRIYAGDDAGGFVALGQGAAQQ